MFIGRFKQRLTISKLRPKELLIPSSKITKEFTSKNWVGLRMNQVKEYIFFVPALGVLI